MHREPLLHFVVLGLGLFLLWGWVRGGDAELVVTAATVERLRSDEARRLGHEPSEAELEAGLDAHVADELLYREGLALGLDRADPVVRRRVVQKMRFLHEDLRPVPEPTAQDLVDFAAERYTVPAQVSFEHVFLRRDGRSPDVLGALVERTMARLSAGDDPSGIGQPFVLGRSFSRRAAPVIERDFGAAFAQALASAETGRWFRADSVYGAHVVRVEERSPPRPPTEEELRLGAADDWKRDVRERNAAAALQELRARTPVRIER